VKQEPSDVSSSGFPWWKTVSLEELHQSASLVETFIEKAEGRYRNDGQEPPERFARAIALNTLVVDDDKFELLLMLVNARLDDLDDALAPGADEQKQATCGELLQTAKESLAVLQRCAQLLSQAVSERVEKAVSTLAKRIGMLNTKCVVFQVQHGTFTSFEAPDKAAFKLIRRSPDG
jgi:hypothetical protein